MLSKEAEITLYRIVQESINNVVKHAQATELEVAIDCGDRAVRARIADNGRGFDLEAARRVQGGMGLAGIEERAAMLHATLNFVSAPGRGTTMTVAIPRQGDQT
jgi:signal transduction histidine kinase